MQLPLIDVRDIERWPGAAPPRSGRRTYIVTGPYKNNPNIVCIVKEINSAWEARARFPVAD